jgi:Arc/MetJ-type ribon-helix-helix transcriptional regulator
MSTRPREVKYSIPVPPEMDRAVQERMRKAGFNSLAEYVRNAIREELERAAHRELEKKLLVAIDRGHYKDAPPEFWDGLRILADRKARPRK